MWRPALSGLLAVTGLISLCAYRKPAVPHPTADAATPGFEETIGAPAGLLAALAPIAIILPEHTPPGGTGRHECAATAEALLRGPLGEAAAGDCAMASVPALPEHSVVAEATRSDGPNAARKVSHHPTRRGPVAVARAPAASEPPRDEASRLPWQFPTDPNVGGSG